jgi:HEPN domain-containing protein
MREEAQLWWQQAKHDLETADLLLKGERLDAASFYCEQAVEKGLKALYIAKHREAPGPTHSLTKLGRDCGLPESYMGFLRRLTGEYYMSRYPDASGDLPFQAYDADDVGEIAKLSREVMAWLEQQMSRF